MPHLPHWLHLWRQALLPAVLRKTASKAGAHKDVMVPNSLQRSTGPLVCIALGVGLKRLLQDAAGMPSHTRHCMQKARPAALESAVAFAKDHDRLPGLHTAAYVCNAKTVKGKSESLFK